jgi:signal transduction histidine kinase
VRGNVSAARLRLLAGIVTVQVNVYKVDIAVLKVLTAFTAFLLLILAPQAVAFLQHQAPEHAPAAAWAMLSFTTILLVYLLLPQPRRWLHRYYLPLALVALSLIPFVGEILSLLSGPVAYSKISLESAFILFAPLFVCAWQYGFRPAVILTLASSAADLALSFAVSSIHADVFRHVVVCRASVFLAAAYITARLVEEQRAQHASLRQANAKLSSYALTLEQLATSRERNRIAREIHDTLAHTLSALAVQLEAVRTTWTSDPEGARAMIDRSLSTTRTGLGETRRTLQSLRASPIEDLGVVLALRNLAEESIARTGATLALELPSEALAMPAELEHGTYRIAEEALENVIRHAGGRKISLSLRTHDEQLELQVRDDGRGFNVGQVPDGVFGLRGMHERAKMLGGALTVASEPGKGTTVIFTAPIPRAPALSETVPPDLGGEP